MKTNGIILLLLSFGVYAQNEIKIAKKEGYENKQEALLQERRRKSLAFFEYTKQIALPSTISTIVSDFQGNTDPSLNKKNFLLNADIQTPIPLGGKRWYFRTEKGEWYNAVHIVPQFKVRIFQNDPLFNDDSQPVRTPSYLPRVSYYCTPSSWIKQKSINGFFGSVFHHSNGQDGDELFADDLNSVPAWRSGLINIYNGNFGEDLVFELGLTHRKDGSEFDIKDTKFYRYDLQKKRLEKGKGKAIFSSSEQAFIRSQARVTFEFHPNNLTNEVFNAMNIYGRHRFNFNQSWAYISFPSEYVKKHGEKPSYDVLTAAKRKEQFRFSLDASFISDQGLQHLNKNLSLTDAGFKRRINAKASFYRRISGTENSAYFLQGGYFGSDDYNIYFGQSGWFSRFGLAFLYFDNEL